MKLQSSGHGGVTDLHSDTARFVGSIAGKSNQLFDTKEFLEKILNTIPLSVFWKDLESRYVGCNRIFAAVAGLNDPSDIVGLTDYDLPWSRQDADAYRADDRRVMESNAPKLHIIEPLRKADGSRIWVDTSKVPLRNIDGSPFGMLGILEDYTDRKSTEESMRKTEILHKLITEKAADVIWTYDLTTDRFTYVSDSVKSLRGYTPEEIRNQNLKDALTPESFDKVMGNFNKALSERVPDDPGLIFSRNIVEQPCKNGSVVSTEVSSTIIFNANGIPVEIIGISRDVTESKQMERLLRMQHELILALNSCTNLREGTDIVLKSVLQLECLDSGGIYILNPSGDSLDLVHHYGLSEQFVARVSHISPDSSSVARLALTGKIWYGPYNDIRPASDTIREGEKLRCLAIIPIMSQGRLIAVLNLASHTHAAIPDAAKSWLETIACHIGGSLLRLRTEVALRESQTRLRSIIDNSNAIIFLKDLDGRYLTVNRRFETLFHVSQQTAAGKSDYEIFLKEYADRFRMNDTRALENIEPIEVEEVFPQDDGLHTYISAKFPTLGNDGRPNALCCIATDITERIKSEEAFWKIQKLESLGILAGGIAHDFNNLLCGIFGYIDMAMEKTKDTTAAGYLVKALGAINRARDLTRQLLTFAKGGTPIKRVDDIAPFIRETVLFLLCGSRVSCNFKIPDDLWMCDFDRNQIGQVLDNIVINAQQAMPEGGTIEISVQNRTVEAKANAALFPGNYIQISIRDHGIGMPKEILPKIFDPFYSTKAQGHGLGLSTCYSIVSRHGGCIDVESEPGRGSTFHVYLPATSANAPEIADIPVLSHRGSGTIIIMDDEPVMRETIGDMLELLGYLVISTQNGNEALDVLKKKTELNQNVTGMIFDLTIPGGMGGKEAIKEVRKLNPDIPVFVASGYAEDPVMAHPKEYGFTASLCKPFRKAELAEMLGRNLTTL